MKFWLAETASSAAELLCCLTGHVHGCWVLNSRWSPVRRLWYWAADAFYMQQDYVGRHDCPYCGKDRPLPSRGHEWSIVDQNITGNTTTASITLGQP